MSKPEHVLTAKIAILFLDISALLEFILFPISYCENIYKNDVRFI